MLRRSFLQALGLAGLAVASPIALGGCAPEPPQEDVDAPAEGELVGRVHKEKTLRALFQVLVPSGDGAPGAAEVQAIEMLRIKNFLPLAITLHIVPDLPPVLQRGLATLDVLLQDLIVLDADAAARAKAGGWFTKFVDLDAAQQTAIVAEKLESDAVDSRLYQFVRAACLVAYLACPFSDLGFEAIGMPRYRDLGDGLHNSGFSDYSYNEIPRVGARTVQNETVNGDLP